MTKKDKDKIRKFFNLMGTFSSIISLIIMIITLIKVERIEELVDTSKEWIMNLELNEPKNNTDVNVKVLRIRGKFDFYTTAVEAHNKGPVNVTMHQNAVDLLCYIRKFSQNNSNQNRYHLQQRPVVRRNGDFEDFVVFGDLSEDDLDTKYQIIVLAVPQKSVPSVRVHDDLPFYLAASNAVVVNRVRQRPEIEK